MADIKKQRVAADEVRELARQGRLVRAFREASTEERRRLRTGAFLIAWLLVYLRVTRPIERRRGHQVCAAGVLRLAPDCLDRFHDDVEAVLDDLFAHADVPIDNVEGWLTMRMKRATVDGYRRRRGERGAAQRPRVPQWLADLLNRDPWLIKLATSVLDWVGVDATAGTSLWPLTAWAAQRAAFTGDHVIGESVVAKEVEVVLAAMRRRPTWYAKNVERPLGRKPVPVHFTSGHAEPEPLALVERHERDDSVLLELAARAIDLIEKRIDGGEDPRAAVADVLGVVFGGLPAAHDLDRSPGDDPVGPAEVVALIGDPQRLNRIVATVVDLLRRRRRPSEG